MSKELIFEQRIEAVRWLAKHNAWGQYVIVFLPEGGCELVKDIPAQKIGKLKQVDDGGLE